MTRFLKWFKCDEAVPGLRMEIDDGWIAPFRDFQSRPGRLCAGHQQVIPPDETSAFVAAVGIHRDFSATDVGRTGRKANAPFSPACA